MHLRKLAIALAVASAALVPFAGTASATTPVSQFGASLGDQYAPATACSSGTCNAGALAALQMEADVFNSGSNVATVRVSFKWTPHTGSSDTVTNSPGGWAKTDSNWDTFDAYMVAAYNAGVTVVPEFHMAKAGGGDYVTPDDTTNCPATDPDCSWTGSDGWQGTIRSFAQRYGPNGSWPTTGVDIPKPAGYSGITTYELWNEPNTSTGSGTIPDADTDLAPATGVNVLEYGSAGLQNAATAKGWSDNLQVLGLAFGPGDGSHRTPDEYVDAMYAIDPAIFDSWSPFTPNSALAGLDTTGLDGTITVHSYAGYSTGDPSTCATTTGHCVRHFATYRSAFDSYTPVGHVQGTEVNMGMTEGGYAGDSSLSTGQTCRTGTSGSADHIVYTDDVQGTYDAGMISWLRANTATVGQITIFDVFAPLDDHQHACADTNVGDSNATLNVGQVGYDNWTEALGLEDYVSGTLTMKASGTTLNNDIATWDP